MAGDSVAAVVLAGQQALDFEPFRLRSFSGDLHLHGWFMPVLFQEEGDTQLIRKVPSRRVQVELPKDRQAALQLVDRASTTSPPFWWRTTPKPSCRHSQALPPLTSTTLKPWPAGLDLCHHFASQSKIRLLILSSG